MSTNLHDAAGHVLGQGPHHANRQLQEPELEDNRSSNHPQDQDNRAEYLQEHKMKA